MLALDFQLPISWSGEFLSVPCCGGSGRQDDLLLICHGHLLVVVAESRVFLRIEQHECSGEDVLDVDDAGGRLGLDDKCCVIGPGQLSRLRSALHGVAGGQVIDHVIDDLLGVVQVDWSLALFIGDELLLCTR